jgi:hypothetical protein
MGSSSIDESPGKVDQSAEILLGGERLRLPACGSFTGLHIVKPPAQDCCVVVAGARVLPVNPHFFRRQKTGQ